MAAQDLADYAAGKKNREAASAGDATARQNAAGAAGPHTTSGSATSRPKR
ncbi:hypothetical protein [Streptomyces xiamenensis]